MDSQKRKDESDTFLYADDDSQVVEPPYYTPRSETKSTKLSIVTTLSFIVMICSIALNVVLLSRPSPSYAFNTDIKDAGKAVSLEQRRFTGAFTYNESSKIAYRKKDGLIEYFGRPSMEINKAWKDLLRGGFPAMTDAEAEEFKPELTRLRSTGKYHFEPDVFHSLHCLNEIRVAVSKTLYNLTADEKALMHHHSLPVELPAGWDEAHMEHCMDRIRQALMCQADLTPSPLYAFKSFPILIGKSGVHTCRKWNPIMEWADERKGQGPWLPPV